MTDQPLSEILAAYLLRNTREGTPDSERQLDARDIVHNWIETDPEQAWRFVELAYQSAISDEELAFVAAGAPEDLLSAHGEQFLDRLETAGRRDARARFMVAGVWRGGMSNINWDRFRAMRERFGIKPI